MGLDHALRGHHRGGRPRQPALHPLLPLHQVHRQPLVRRGGAEQSSPPSAPGTQAASSQAWWS